MQSPFSLGDPARCGLSNRQHTLLWLVALLTFVVGDSLTTAVGLWMGAVESNPLAATVLERIGLVGMVGLKLAILGVLYGLYYLFDATTRFCLDDEAALFVAGLGLVVSGWNAYVIYLA